MKIILNEYFPSKPIKLKLMYPFKPIRLNENFYCLRGADHCNGKPGNGKPGNGKPGNGKPT